MKKLLFIVLILFCNVFILEANINFETSPVEVNINCQGIDDGWYTAKVVYNNFKTGTYATYTLSVEVQSNSVVTISFDKGGSLHNGYNNEGYIYSGGYLSFSTDSRGNIISAHTSVTISDSNGIKSFEITIQ